MGKVIDRVRARQAAVAASEIRRLEAEHQVEMLWLSCMAGSLRVLDEAKAGWREDAPSEPAQRATGATQDPGQGCGVGGVACGAPANLQGPAR